MNITHIETQHYSQDQDTIDWFDIDGDVWGINKRNGEFRLIDCDGCPVDLPTYDDQVLIDAMVNASEYFTE